MKFSKISAALPAISKGINVVIWIYLFIVLGYSMFTKTPILELEWFDSQRWILLFVVNTGLKSSLDDK